MIRKFLTAKHWQLFVLMFAIPFVLQIFGMVQLFGMVETFEAMEHTGDVSPEFVMDSMMSYFGIFIVVIVVMSLLFLGWLWSVGVGLQDKITEELKMKTGLFKAALIFPNSISSPTCPSSSSASPLGHWSTVGPFPAACSPS